MNFGQAIEAMKKGKSVSRAGWNGKGMKISVKGFDALGMLPCIVLVTAQGEQQPGWNASTPDVLAEDWGIAA